MMNSPFYDTNRQVKLVSCYILGFMTQMALRVHCNFGLAWHFKRRLGHFKIWSEELSLGPVLKMHLFYTASLIENVGLGFYLQGIILSETEEHTNERESTW